MSGNTRTIRLVLDASDLEQSARRTNQSLAAITNSSNRTADALTRIQTIGASLAVLSLADNFARVGLELALTAEKFDLLSKKMVTLTGDTKSMEKTIAMANNLGIAFEDVAGVLGRFSVATKNAFSVDTMQKWISGVVLSGRLAGGTLKELQAGMHQLSQGMASAATGGGLMGDELRSVMENLPLLARALHDEFVGTTKSLKQLGSEGKITGEVMASAMEKLYDRTKDLPGLTDTVSASVARLGNNWSLALNEILGSSDNFITRFIQNLSDLTLWLKDNTVYVKDLANFVLNLGIAFASLKLASLILAVANFTGNLFGVGSATAFVNTQLAVMTGFFSRLTTGILLSTQGLAVWTRSQYVAGVASAQLSVALGGSTVAAWLYVKALQAASWATRALAFAMRFLLGPWGLLLTTIGLVVGSFYTYTSGVEDARRESELAAETGSLLAKQKEEERIKTEEANKVLAEELRLRQHLSRIEAPARREEAKSNISNLIVEQTKRLTEAQKQLTLEQDKSIAQGKIIYDIVLKSSGSVEKATTALNKFKKSNEETNPVLIEAKKKVNAFEEAIKALQKAFDLIKPPSNVYEVPGLKEATKTYSENMQMLSKMQLTKAEMTKGAAAQEKEYTKALLDAKNELLGITTSTEKLTQAEKDHKRLMSDLDKGMDPMIDKARKLTKLYVDYILGTSKLKVTLEQYTKGMGIYTQKSKAFKKATADNEKQIKKAAKSLEKYTDNLSDFNKESNRMKNSDVIGPDFSSAEDFMTDSIKDYIKDLNKGVISETEYAQRIIETNQAFLDRKDILSDNYIENLKEQYDSTIGAQKRFANGIAEISFLMDKQAISAILAAKSMMKLTQEYKSVGRAQEKTNFTKGLDSDLKRVVSGMFDVKNAFEDIATLEATYSAQTNKTDADKFEYQQKQLDMYGNLAGAASKMFKEGSDGAKAAMIAEQAFAIAKGITAIMNQGMGDPYTAIPRMIAMAAMVASFVGDVGDLGGSGASTGLSSNVNTSTNASNTSTVLGDASAKSESLSNSLETLEEYAKPEFELMSQMTASLISIDGKLGGVASILMRQGGFAFGEGFEEQLPELTGMAKIFTILEDVPVLGGITNFIAGGLFGKTKKEMIDYGIKFNKQLLDSAISGVDAVSFQTVEETTKSWFSSSSDVEDNFSDVSDEVANQFSLVFGEIGSVITDSLVGLGAELGIVEGLLSDVILEEMKISFVGKTGDEIQEELSNFFSAQADMIVNSVAGSFIVPFQKIGEGLFETLVRVSRDVQVSDYYVSKLGQRFEDVTIKFTDVVNKQGDVGAEIIKQTIINAEELVGGMGDGVLDIMRTLTGSAEDIYNAYRTMEDVRLQINALGSGTLTSSTLFGAGGLDNLQGSLDGIIGLLGEGKQFQIATDRATKAFEALGFTLPSTAQGFLNLLASIDTVDEEGQKLWGQVAALEGVFTDFISAQDAYKQTITDERDLKEELTASMIDEFVKLQDAKDRLLGVEDYEKALRVIDNLGGQFGRTAEDVVKYIDSVNLRRQADIDHIQSIYELTDAIVFMRDHFGKIKESIQDLVNSNLTPLEKASNTIDNLSEKYDIDLSLFDVDALQEYAKSLDETDPTLLVLIDDLKLLNDAYKDQDDAIKENLEAIEEFNTSIEKLFNSLYDNSDLETSIREIQEVYNEFGVLADHTSYTTKDLAKYIKTLDGSDEATRDALPSLQKLGSAMIRLKDIIKSLQSELDSLKADLFPTGDEARLEFLREQRELMLFNADLAGEALLTDLERYQAAIDANKTIMDLLDELKISDLKNQSPLEQMQAAGKLFNESVALGDVDKAAGYAKDYLDFSQKFYASTQQYSSIFDDVTSKLESMIVDPSSILTEDPKDIDSEFKGWSITDIDYQIKLLEDSISAQEEINKNQLNSEKLANVLVDSSLAKDVSILELAASNDIDLVKLTENLNNGDDALVKILLEIAGDNLWSTNKLAHVIGTSNEVVTDYLKNELGFTMDDINAWNEAVAQENQLGNRILSNIDGTLNNIESEASRQAVDLGYGGQYSDNQLLHFIAERNNLMLTELIGIRTDSSTSINGYGGQFTDNQMLQFIGENIFNLLQETIAIRADGALRNEGIWLMLQNSRALNTGLNVPSYLNGTDFVPENQYAYLHQGEMVIDPSTSQQLRQYGISGTPVQDNDEIIEELRQLREEVSNLRQINSFGFKETIEHQKRQADAQEDVVNMERLK